MANKHYCALTILCELLLRMLCYRSYKRFLIFVLLAFITYTLVSYIPTTRPAPSLEYGENGEVKGIKDYSRGELKVLGVENGDIEDEEEVKEAAEAVAKHESESHIENAKPENEQANNFQDDDTDNNEDTDEQNAPKFDKDLEQEDDAPIPHNQFSGPLEPIPEKFIDAEKCPACFGIDMCEEIQKGEVKIEKLETATKLTKRGFHYGVFQNKAIMIKTYAGGYNFQQYEEYMCRNITGQMHCDIAKEIKKSFTTKESAVDYKVIKRAFRVAHSKPEEMLNVVCVTHSLIEQFQDAVDQGPKIAATPFDNVVLYANIVIYPEVVNFKFLTNLEIGWAIPGFIGSCGRMIVLDHVGKPLELYLHASWEKRADLAMQLLQTIDAFINGDNAWFVMFSGFTFENFQVSNLGKLKIVDLQDMGFVDKDAAGDYELPEDARACNEDCFLFFFRDLYDYGHPLQETTCAKATHVAANAMYALACRDILSDLPEHKNYLDRPHKNYPGAGLLHSMPQKYKTELSDALYECVEEANVGSRLAAVEEMLEILSQFVGHQTM